MLHLSYCSELNINVLLTILVNDARKDINMQNACCSNINESHFSEESIPQKYYAITNS